MKKKLFMISFLFFYHAPLQAQVNQGIKQTTVITNPADPTMNATVTTTTVPVVIGPSEEDQRIVTAVYDKFARASALIGTSLSVSCESGVVTISGTVVSQSQADAAVDAAQSVPNVKGVRSRISVTTNPGLNRSVAAPNY